MARKPALKLYQQVCQIQDELNIPNHIMQTALCMTDAEYQRFISARYRPSTFQLICFISATHRPLHLPPYFNE